MLRAVGCRFVILFTVPLAGCSTTTLSPITFDTQEWADGGFAGRRLSTLHFDIYSTLRDEEFESALPGFVEAAYGAYEKLLRSPPGRNERLVLYVFGLRTEWEAFTKRRFPVRFPIYRRIRNGGFSEGNVSVLFCQNRGSALATIAHEGWHQYVSSRFTQVLPAWLNEGLACGFESVDSFGVRPRFDPNQNTFRINSLREGIQQDNLMSLAEIIETDAGRMLAGKSLRNTDAYYAQVWALITFLRRGAGGRYRADFDRLLEDIADDTFGKRLSADRLLSGESAAKTLGETVFRIYFRATPNELEARYYDHLVRLSGY